MGNLALCKHEKHAMLITNTFWFDIQHTAFLVIASNGKQSAKLPSEPEHFGEYGTLRIQIEKIY